MIYLLEVMIFHSYVSLPEGMGNAADQISMDLFENAVYAYIPQMPTCKLGLGTYILE